jgi:hypothetical protein
MLQSPHRLVNVIINILSCDSLRRSWNAQFCIYAEDLSIYSTLFVRVLNMGLILLQTEALKTYLQYAPPTLLLYKLRLFSTYNSCD